MSSFRDRFRNSCPALLGGLAAVVQPRRRWALRSSLICVILGLIFVPAMFVPAAIAAPHWQLTGQSSDGLARQYVDLDSLEGKGSLWTVRSYFTERQTNERQADEHKTNQILRADYVTLYDCVRHLYKDVNPDGTTSPDDGESWGSADADPLNQATMDYVCDVMAPEQGGLADPAS